MVLIRNQKLFRSVRNNLHEDHNFDLEMYRVLLAGQIESCRFNIWCNTCKKHLDYQELKTILRDSFTEWKQTY